MNNSIDQEFFKNYIDDPDLEVTEELVGMHAGLNPFINTISGSRAVMFSNHISQAIAVENGETKIIQTGIESQFKDNTFSKKFDEDVMIINVVKRYNGVGDNYVNADVGFTIIFRYVESGEVDYLEVPKNFKLHQYFGFKYKINEEVADLLTPGAVIPKDTVIADAPVAGNDSLNYGINANVLYLSIPETTEDCMVISKSAAKRLSYKIYETRVVEFGTDSFPLNIYGDDEVYKSFPDIGETVGDDSILIALREYDELLTPALTSINDVKEVNPVFDKVYYVKSPESKVVDIKVIHSPVYKKSVYSNTNNGINKYINSYNKYYNEILDVYENIKKEHYLNYGTNDVKISEAFSRLVLEAYTMTNRDKHKIKFYYKKNNLDIYRLEFTIETTITPVTGNKVTLLTGSKGIVRDDDKMPVSLVTGEKADIVIESRSVMARTNVANLYEQYFSGASRKVKRMVISYVNNDINTIYNMSADEIDKLFEIPLGLLKIIGTEQYDAYLNANTEEKREILIEIFNKEFYIYYKISSKKKPYEVSNDIMNSIYRPDKGKVQWEDESGKIHVSEKDVLIEPQYMIILGKTADNFLSSASPFLNHYGVPTSVSSSYRDMIPYRNSSVKALSESESRLYGAYTKSLNFLAELKDRASSIPTHKHIYRELLELDKPTAIDDVTNRSEVPYGNDSSLKIVNSIFNSLGMELQYAKDNNIYHDVIE